MDFVNHERFGISTIMMTWRMYKKACYMVSVWKENTYLLFYVVSTLRNISTGNVIMKIP